MYHLRVNLDSILTCPQKMTGAYSSSCATCSNYAGIQDGFVHCNFTAPGYGEGIIEILPEDVAPATFPPPSSPPDPTIPRGIGLKKDQVYVKCPKPWTHESCNIMECRSCKDHKGLTFSDVLCSYPEP